MPQPESNCLICFLFEAKYVYDLYGTELSVYMNGNKIEAGLGRLAMLGM